MEKKIAANVPKSLLPLFEEAEKRFSNFFKKLKRTPSKGNISIDAERYLLVRSSSLSIDFFQEIISLFNDDLSKDSVAFARQLLFDIAHSIGKKDAKHYAEKLGLTTPEEKLASGPIHFAYSGWAFVDILPESSPSADEDFYLIYNHPYSFEADSWLKSEKKPENPVCIMNAGYSSGWCEEAFGMDLVASEIHCKALGDDHCRFIMAPPHKIKSHIESYIDTLPHDKVRILNYEIPEFFKLKKIHDELEKKNEQLRSSIIELKNTEQKLKYFAEHDVLTGLHNRVAFIDKMEMIMKICDRHKTKVAVLYIDIDSFKKVNDTLGHSAGDKLIINFAKRLESSVRKSDIVARLGGDEFAVLVYDFKDIESISCLCQKILNNVSKAYGIKKNKINSTASIGVAIYPDHCDSVEKCIERGDSAMYTAKKSMHKNYYIYE